MKPCSNATSKTDEVSARSYSRKDEHAHRFQTRKAVIQLLLLRSGSDFYIFDLLASRSSNEIAGFSHVTHRRPADVATTRRYEHAHVSGML